MIRNGIALRGPSSSKHVSLRGDGEKSGDAAAGAREDTRVNLHKIPTHIHTQTKKTHRSAFCIFYMKESQRDTEGIKQKQWQKQDRYGQPYWITAVRNSKKKFVGRNFSTVLYPRFSDDNFLRQLRSRSSRWPSAQKSAVLRPAFA